MYDDLKGLDGLEVFELDGLVVACDKCDKTDTCYAGACADATLRYIAAELEKLGYVKVTRCGECENDGCSCDVKVFAPGLTYCSAAVPVVAENATGEEVSK